MPVYTGSYPPQLWSTHRWRCYVCGVGGPDVETQDEAEQGRLAHEQERHPEWVTDDVSSDSSCAPEESSGS